LNHIFLYGSVKVLVSDLFLEEWKPLFSVVEVPAEQSGDFILLDIGPYVFLADDHPQLFEWALRIIVNLAKNEAFPGHWIP